VDYYIFIKNGYSFLTHLVPFAIAALVLMILSVPTDNMLLKLAKTLKQPSWIWLPAIMLTIITTLAYITNIYTQIRRAYLWSEGDVRRTIGTSVTYMLLCTLIGYTVLRSASTSNITLSDVWTCFLVAILSLIGIGWSGPKSLVESIGVQSPNYTDGRRYVTQLTGILQRTRSKPRGEAQDVQEFFVSVKNILENLDKNLVLEPEWAKDNLLVVQQALKTLAEHADRFTDDNVEYFAAACSCQMKDQFQKFLDALNSLGSYWPEWQCPTSE
jgi:hypothetical protein